jgi:hypothetical protein
MNSGCARTTISNHRNQTEGNGWDAFQITHHTSLLCHCIKPLSTPRPTRGRVLAPAASSIQSDSNLPRMSPSTAQSLWQTARKELRRGRCRASCNVHSFLPACLLAATLIAAPAAHAVCRSPKNVCKHISDCLDRKVDPGNNVVVQIRDGVKTHNGKMVRAGADACAVDLGIKREWDKWSSGCSDTEYVAIAKAEIENGKALCDRYSQ